MKKLIYSQEDVDLMISIETQQYQEDLEYEHYCNEQLRNKITNLENKIKRLEEDNKYKIVLYKIKEYCNNRLEYYNEMRRDYNREFDGYAENDIENILELLEEIE